jgi:hypothetical protein
MRVKPNAEGFRQSNEECARIILADVDRYGGAESLMVRWPWLVMSPEAERSRHQLAAPEAQPLRTVGPNRRGDAEDGR